MKRILLILSMLMAVLAVILSVNYFAVRSAQVAITPVQSMPVDDAAIDRLSQAIQLPTVTGQFDPARFIRFLKDRYPGLHQQAEVRVIKPGGLVLKWRAEQSQHKPILLLAHYDVVPADNAGWQHPPFSGHVDAKYVWGRGSMDDKSSLMAMLEAIDLLRKQDYQPTRDIYLAFGHDEETGGQQGAGKIARYFAEQNLQFEYVLDEGMVITDGILSLVDKPVALLGIAEKGYADIELILAGQGGHASMPGQRTLLADLSTALSKLQAQPLAAQLTTSTRQMLTVLAPEAKFMARLSLSNLWLFKPLVMQRFKQAPATHAAIHTTFAPTQMFASERANVLPQQVSAIINVRMLPGTTSKQVLNHIRRVIDDDRIDVQLLQAVEPSEIASTTSWAYQQLSRSIRQVFTDTLVAPGLVIPATDSRHYRALALQTYRFLPITVTQQDLPRFHGRDERIAKADYKAMIRFYYHCIKNSTSN